MSSLWLSDYKQDKFDPSVKPQCDYDTLVSDMYSEVSSAPNLNYGKWDTLPTNKPQHKSNFRILKPECKGFHLTPELEQRTIDYSYAWVIRMNPRIKNQKCFEATILLLAVATVVEDEVIKLYKNSNFETMDAFGYTIGELLDMLGEVLVPGVMKRLKYTLFTEMAFQDRHKKSQAKKEDMVQEFLTLKSDFSTYLRFRNMDGFFEGGLLCAYAINDVSCANLKCGTVNDIIEACVLLHDTNNVIRHRLENDAANIHNYTENLNGSMEKAYSRASCIYERLHSDINLDSNIREVGSCYLLSYYTFYNSTKRYGVGIQTIEATCRAVDQVKQLPGALVTKPSWKLDLNYVKGIVNGDFDFSDLFTKFIKLFGY